MLQSMRAGTILHPVVPWNPESPRSLYRSPSNFRCCFTRASSTNPTRNGVSGGGGYRGPKPRRDWVADWVSNNDDTVRSLPIFIGGASLLAVLVNRAVSGIAPVADASSSQSRADLLTLGLAVTNILAGLVWLTIRPKYISKVNPEGVECRVISSQLPDDVDSELLWAWESLSAATCCRSLVVVYDCSCILQIGVAAESLNNEALSVDATKLMQGSLYQAVMKSGAQSYLANLSLYPGRSELPFLPSNTQAVILQPLGDKGIAIIGGDTVRGFTTSDQAWITFIGEKLDATLSRCIVNIPLAVEERI
ncbi:Protein COFACTOR ASSEMBLY OF COMPLEX C SUBUNIT B ccb4, chloroplastic [Turnera subulata]|uniref:Protein COFACTOR ASSEMBLY OF COMPLEX C SUBUNIT B ccb4, chloroplastic n=1 Tax=Turnera subulata TaxID=218843 RepID=A0A9Q0FS40_9ROSI|nr:Protein COFACTOR ASSEMBLY OF COMPLEX C SUBUNIT B ccb4, chloroplastic [Turnera subulata]